MPPPLGFALVISGAGSGLSQPLGRTCAFMAARAVALQLRWRSEHWLHTTI
ncbi:MAG: hypothetical protein R2710_02345 [Acidimicrobiales bacterium]